MGLEEPGALKERKAESEESVTSRNWGSGGGGLRDPTVTTVALVWSGLPSRNHAERFSLKTSPSPHFWGLAVAKGKHHCTGLALSPRVPRLVSLRSF